MTPDASPPRPSHAELDRYLADAASLDERAQVDAWLAAEPEAASFLTALQRVATNPCADVAQVDVDAMMQKVHEQLVGDVKVWGGRGRTAQGKVSWGRQSLRGITRVAIGALMLTAIFIGVQWSWESQPPHSYTTHAAQLATVTLDDGTRVILAPSTRLDVAPGFGHRTRTVTLSGEAHFDVRATAGVPFAVRTGAVTTTVLGTVFAVRRYAGDDTTHVAVMSGKVRTGGAHTIALTAGAVARVTDSAAFDTVADQSMSIDWIRGKLIFNEAPVLTVLTTMGRWYGYRFELADPSLAKQHVSTTLSMTDSAAMIVNLQALLGVTMTFDGHVVTLRPSHASDHAPARMQQRLKDTHNQSLEYGR